MDKISVIVISDFVLLRSGLHALLARSEQVDVRGECGLGATAVQLVHEKKPAVLVLDMSDCETPATETLQDLRRQASDLPIVAISPSADRELILELLRYGVRGYLSNREAEAELVRAVETVAGGEIYLCPRACDALLEGYRGQSRAKMGCS